MLTSVAQWLKPESDKNKMMKQNLTESGQTSDYNTVQCSFLKFYFSIKPKTQAKVKTKHMNRAIDILI